MVSDPEFNPETAECRFLPVFTTGRLLEFSMAEDLLKQSRIPFQAQEETATGLKLSMPVAPTPEPGVFWSLLVPETLLDQARSILAELPFPITTNPSPWHFLPKGDEKSSQKDLRAMRWLFSIQYLALGLLAMSAGIIQLLHSHGHVGGALGLISFGMVVAAIVIGLIWHSRRWSKSHGSLNRKSTHD